MRCLPLPSPIHQAPPLPTPAHFKPVSLRTTSRVRRAHRCALYSSSNQEAAEFQDALGPSSCAQQVMTTADAAVQSSPTATTLQHPQSTDGQHATRQETVQQSTAAGSQRPCEVEAHGRGRSHANSACGGTGQGNRRSLLTALASAAAVAGVSLQAAVHPEAAQALRTIELPNGQMVAVYEHGMSLAIVALRGSVPQQWIMDFKTSLGKYAGFTLGQRQQLEEIYKDLSDPTTKNSAGAADVVTLGDAWLAQAIRDRLVQPIANAESYRWGATLIAYRKDRLLRRGGHIILDWADLLQPQLQGRVALTDSSRELLGLALKTLGMGYNPSAAQLAAAGITEEVLARQISLIRRQVRLFSSNEHVRALQAGDVWAVVGWSQDLITLAERSNSVEAIVPASGTSLFADIWAVPHGAQGGNLQSGPSPLLPSWLEFGLMPARIPGHPGLKAGAAPLLLPEPETVPSKADSKSMQADSKSMQEDSKSIQVDSSNPHGSTSEDPMPPPAPSEPEGVGIQGATLVAGTDAVEEGLVLRHGEGYMPKDKDVLRRSEFMLPLSPAVRTMYRSALRQASRV
ncbi:hypothetical protein DUNSADRAFT_12136 [Dunaliella salina]|uniref:Uncharacterized protein n=1 Tax=Dunaliella salina TaxID=3046 RepID=A0ABQ7GBZ3_DUNSA|nr:hypothetical protein DUNSADRAFT_12136 [Dunaliella salina]|eukprot:KAF5832125.1 hypothetical protein DUNSADRAFT_12136 [Dunaliella salina]